MKPDALAAIPELFFAQSLMKKLIKLPNKLWCLASDGVFANKLFQMGFLAGHQIDKLHTIESILKRSGRIPMEVS